MSELILPPQDINDEVKKYGQTMLHFMWSTDFPEGLVTNPDHVMIKSATPSDFDKRVKSISPWAEQKIFVEVDTRFLVAARLIVPMALTEYKEVNWIEIMESKSPDGTADYLGVEYVEFYHSDFNQAGLFMKRKKVDAEKRVDGLHRWWNIRMNDEGQELRITDKPLSEIIDKELDESTARHLKLAA